jgi:hypothetical protein
VRSLVVDPFLVVAENPVVKTLEFASKLTDGPSCQLTEITFGIAGMFPRNLNLPAEAQIMTAEYFGACHQSSREGLVMAVPYSNSPGPFKDSPSGQGDVQNAEVPLSVVTQRMGLFRYDEAAALELIVYFTEDPAVRQRKPRFRIFGCGYLPQISQAY